MGGSTIVSLECYNFEGENFEIIEGYIMIQSNDTNECKSGICWNSWIGSTSFNPL